MTLPRIVDNLRHPIQLGQDCHWDYQMDWIKYEPENPEHQWQINTSLDEISLHLPRIRGIKIRMGQDLVIHRPVHENNQPNFEKGKQYKFK